MAKPASLWPMGNHEWDTPRGVEDDATAAD